LPGAPSQLGQALPHSHEYFPILSKLSRFRQNMTKELNSDKQMNEQTELLVWHLPSRGGSTTGAGKMKMPTDIDTACFGDASGGPLLAERSPILDVIAEHLVLHDTELNVVWANKAAGDSVGAAASDLVGRHCYEIWHGRGVACDGCPVRSALDTGKPHELETKSPDGREWFIKAYPLKDADGKITGCVEVTMDITDRKRAEMELSGSEDNLRQLVDQSLQGLLILQDMRVAFANSAMTRMSGFTADQFLAFGPEDLQAFVHPDDREMVWARYRSRLAGKDVPQQYVVRAFRKDGSVWWLDLHSKRITYNGRPAIQCVVLDITERKQAEQARKESEDKYGNLFQHSNDAILIHDLEGNILDVNRRTLQMFGCSKSEISSARIQDLHPQEDLEKAKWAFEAIARDGFVSFEIRFLKKNDEVFPAEVSSSMFEINGQKVIQGIVRDITERKNAERAIRQSEEQHRSLVENINEVIFTLDTQGRFTYISPVLKRVLGYTPSEIAGRPFNWFVHTDDVAGFLVKLEESLSGGLQTYELKVLSKDGKTHHMLVSSRPLHQDDRPVGFTGIMADVTETKLAGAVIREKEEMYETLVRTTTDAVTVTDLQGTITEVSPRAVQLYGYESPEDLIGKSAFELIAPESQTKALANFKLTLKEGFLRLAEYTFLRKDGTRFVGEFDSAVVKDADGNPKGFIAAAKDVTERKRAEEALRRSEQRFRDIAAHASEWIWEVDASGIYTYSSPVVKRILGYEPEEILGKHFYDLYPPEEREQAKEAAFDMFVTKRPFRDHLNRNLHKYGHEVILSTSGVPILDDDGSLLGYRGADTDITKRCGQTQPRS